MKTIHFAIILIFSVSFVIVDNDAFADSTNNIEIINIQTHPSVIKLGDVFTVSATLVNNSPNPISVVSSPCGGPFTVKFDNHITIDVKKETGCPLMKIVQEINTGDKTTGTNPPSQFVAYRATQAGTANVNIKFSYLVRNQTDHNPSTIAKTISKSLLFTILGNTQNQTRLGDTVYSLGPDFGLKSPLKQLESGTSPLDITCQVYLQLIFKKEDGSPACVKTATVQILIEHNWGHFPLRLR